MPSSIMNINTYNRSAEFHYAQFRAGITNPYDEVYVTDYYIGPKPSSKNKKDSKVKKLFKKMAKKLE
jgi:hypothetical protein